MEQFKVDLDAKKVGAILIAKKGLILGAAVPLMATAVWNDIDVSEMPISYDQP